MLVFVLETQFFVIWNTRAKFLAKVSSPFFFSGRIERSKRLVAGFQELVLDCWKNGPLDVDALSGKPVGLSGLIAEAVLRFRIDRGQRRIPRDAVPN